MTTQLKYRATLGKALDTQAKNADSFGKVLIAVMPEMWASSDADLFGKSIRSHVVAYTEQTGKFKIGSASYDMTDADSRGQFLRERIRMISTTYGKLLDNIETYKADPTAHSWDKALYSNQAMIAKAEENAFRIFMKLAYIFSKRDVSDLKLLKNGKLQLSFMNDDGERENASEFIAGIFRELAVKSESDPKAKQPSVDKASITALADELASRIEQATLSDQEKDSLIGLWGGITRALDGSPDEIQNAYDEKYADVG